MKKLYGLLLSLFVFCYTNGQEQYVDLKSSSNRISDPKSYFHREKVSNPCNYEQIDNNLENGYRNEVGGLYEEADDITIPADECWSITQVISSHFVNGGIASLDITIYDDAGGIPGSVNEAFFGLVSFTSEIIGSNYGYDVYEADLTLPLPIVLCGGASGTTYWLSIMVTPVVGGNMSFWHSQSIYPYGSNFAQDAGSGWYIPGNGDLVFQLIYTKETTNDVTLCYGDGMWLEGEFRTETGTYYDTLTGAMGCDSVIITNLTILPQIDVSVTIAGNMFTVGEMGASYQWVDCTNDYTPIPGETNQSFYPISSGYYAVIVTQGMCTDTSDCYYFPEGFSTCNYIQIGNNLENGFGNTIGGTQEIADEINIPINQCWNVTQIISSHFVNGDISSMDFRIYDDAGGLPGSVIQEMLNVTDFTSVIIGNNYGYDVYEADATLPETLELCGGPSGTTYWLSIMVAPVVGGNLTYWESQTIYSYGVNFAFNTGGGWLNSGSGDLVFQLIFPVVTTNSVTLCFGEGMVLEGEYQTESGTYYDTLTSSMGCDSVVITILTIQDEIDNTVNATATTLSANQDGASYQWVDCNDGYAPIAGATDQSFEPSSSGDYAVIITQGSCSDTSSCVEFTAVNNLESPNSSYFTIYPNPNNGHFTIVFSEFEANSVVELYNSLGKLLLKEELTSNSYQIDAGEIDKGVYFIKILRSDQNFTERVVIE
jgi:hypothetical protein